MVANGPSKGHTEPLGNRYPPGFTNVRRRPSDADLEERRKRPTNEATYTFPSSSKAGSFGAEESQPHTQPIGRRSDLPFEESAKRLRELVESRSPKKRLHTAPVTERYRHPDAEPRLPDNPEAYQHSDVQERLPSTSPVRQHQGHALQPEAHKESAVPPIVRTPPQDTNNVMGLRRQWEYRNRQAEALKAERLHQKERSQGHSRTSSTSMSPAVDPYRAGETPKKQPSTKDLVERMIAYSRTMSNETNTHVSANPADPDRMASNFARLQSRGVPENAPDVLAPSPLLSEKPGNLQKQGNITMHTDLNAFKWPTLSRTAPVRPAPRFITKHPSLNGPTRGPIPNSYRQREPKANTSILETPKTRPRSSSRLASTPPEIVVSESHFTPHSQQLRSSPVDQPAPARSQEFMPVAITPTSDQVEDMQSNTQKPAKPAPPQSQNPEERTQRQAEQSKSWKEIQWRQFSIAMRDSISEQKLSLNCTVALLTGMLSRLPPEMHDLSLDEIVKRLVVWINSTDNLNEGGRSK